jgi:hypothetical protein
VPDGVTEPAIWGITAIAIATNKPIEMLIQIDRFRIADFSLISISFPISLFA